MSADRHVLLPRDAFRTRVLARRDGRCCVPECDRPAVDAHHILERRLWPDHGYYEANGAQLCAEHHLKAETTEIPVESLRAWCGITDAPLPPHLDPEDRYDKWGNPVLPNGMRLRGELFFDEAVQKVLGQAGMLSLYTHWVKYSRTYHMPFSPGATADDKVHESLKAFTGKRVIGSVKMDGEGFTLYADHCHARSLDSKHHPSRDWIKAFWNAVRWDIPPEWRVCGEYMFAQHSIPYSALPSYFLGFSVWDERNCALPWDETLEWFDLIGSATGQRIVPAPVVYDDVFDERRIRALCERLVSEGQEGLVIRLADGFPYRDFRTCTAKYVRKNHVQTDEHWMHGEIVRNGLAPDAQRLGGGGAP